MRTGDTPQRERQRIVRHPPDVLITTPESLFLMLTSRARSVLEGVGTLIVDEIHAMAATKRGAHLAVSVERLEALVAARGGRLQRIGLSATQRPLSEIARFLGGQGPGGVVRPVTIADAGTRAPMEIEVIVPVEDMAALASDGPHALAADTEFVLGGGGTTGSIWPTIYPELVALIRAHTSTLVFVNNRRLAERLSLRINELAGEDIARAHHGSLAREQRTIIEEQLKAGQLPALVATSSLELGIDMGAIDLVIQVESPRSVARGIQRIGRSGHHVGGQSKGQIFPKFRGDLLECAAVVARMRTGEIEHTVVPRLPLDVLAQQLVAICADDEWALDDIEALVRASYPFAELTREQLENKASTVELFTGHLDRAGARCGAAGAALVAAIVPGPVEPAPVAITVELSWHPGGHRRDGTDSFGHGYAAGAAVIPVPTGVQIWIATGHTDMRRGMRGLALQVQELGRDPFLCVACDYVAARSRHGQWSSHARFCRHIIFPIESSNWITASLGLKRAPC